MVRRLEYQERYVMWPISKLNNRISHSSSSDEFTTSKYKLFPNASKKVKEKKKKRKRESPPSAQHAPRCSVVRFPSSFLSSPGWRISVAAAAAALLCSIPNRVDSATAAADGLLTAVAVAVAVAETQMMMLQTRHPSPLKMNCPKA